MSADTLTQKVLKFYNAGERKNKKKASRALVASEQVEFKVAKIIEELDKFKGDIKESPLEERVVQMFVEMMDVIDLIKEQQEWVMSKFKGEKDIMGWGLLDALVDSDSSTHPPEARTVEEVKKFTKPQLERIDAGKSHLLRIINASFECAIHALRRMENLGSNLEGAYERSGQNSAAEIQKIVAMEADVANKVEMFQQQKENKRNEMRSRLEMRKEEAKNKRARDGGGRHRRKKKTKRKRRKRKRRRTKKR